VENGPQPDQEFLDLIGEAVQMNGLGDRCIPNGQNHLVIDMAPLYKAVIRSFLESEYPKVWKKMNMRAIANLINALD